MNVTAAYDGEDEDNNATGDNNNYARLGMRKNTQIP